MTPRRTDVPDFIRHSWRWNDLDALRHDYAIAIAKRDEARGVRSTLGALSVLGTGSALGKKALGRQPLGVLARGLGSPLLGAASTAAAYTAEREEAHRQRHADALQDRINLLSRSRSR